MTWDITVTYISLFAALAANVAVVVSLYLQRRELREHTRELTYSVYERLMGEFSNVTLKLVESSDLREAFVFGAEPAQWHNYDQPKRALFFYFDSLLGLFERVWYSCQSSQGGSEEDWQQWKNWIKELAANAVFVDLLNESEGLYDSGFLKEVKEVAATVRSTHAM